ncbi:MAG: EF-P beta-lysylation protein EpmB [Halioglobus sp.]
MIPHTEPQWQTLPWQHELKAAFRRPLDLLSFLGLPADNLDVRNIASSEFSMLVPRPFAQRMKMGDPLDPLLLQVLPAAEELHNPVNFTTDPLQEASSNPQPGIVHKYRGRVLLICATGCAVNCRYCFRRHFDYSENNPGRDHWPATLDYIRRDTSIKEVILSGGDPLLLGDDVLTGLIAQIQSIAHVTRLRIHTRLPIVLPSRITSDLCEMLGNSGLKPVMVIHSNHSNEIDADVVNALDQLRTAGVTLLNQSVLLSGVNDSADVLAQLSDVLFDNGVMPYYLHLLDKVNGAAGFALSDARAMDIYRELLSRSPGYLVPKLVRELPGHPSKVTLSPYA